MAVLESRLQSALASRRRRSMLRSLDGGPPENLVDFSSNDYLSFSKSHALRERLSESLSTGRSDLLLGPSSSRLLDGNTTLHRGLERRLANFFGGPGEALLFNSGYDANVGVWSTLPAETDWIIYDELIHASTHDGMRASRSLPSRRIPFKHNDTTALQRAIQEVAAKDTLVASGSASVFVAIETLYSMDGDLCPLPEMLTVLEQTLPKGNGHVILDEAHSTGLYGPCGRGLAAHYGLSNHPRLLIRLHTFGKAAACSGAVVICSPLLRDYFINYARPLIYSTVMMRMNVRAIDAAIDEFESQRRDEAASQLTLLSRRLIGRTSDLLASPRPGSRALHLRLPEYLQGHSPSSIYTPIIPLLTPSPRQLSAFLISKGYLTRPIVYPTVPQGEERVRICLHAGNTVEQLDGLVEALTDWLKLQDASEEREAGKMVSGHSDKEGGSEIALSPPTKIPVKL